MPPRFIDPFTPNRPIDDPDRFIGREEAVNELINTLFQTMSKNPKHTIITGERGVGKSSLLTQIYKTSQGDNRLTDRLRIETGIDKYNYLSVWHDVDVNQGIEELASSILSRFDSEIKKLFKGIKVEFDIKGFIKISKEKMSKTSISDYVDEFVSRLKTIETNATEQGKSGVAIFIDELDRVQLNSGISTFFKLTTERLSRDNIKSVAFICAGITGAVQKLEEEHASILRTFRDVPLKAFNQEEVWQILSSGFTLAGRKIKDVGAITKKAWEVTIGLPETIHLIGSEMLSVDKDGILDINDFEASINKIVTDVRKNKLESLLRKAGGGKYQKILEAMAKYEKKIVPLEYIASNIKQDQSQFSTNMGTLIDREILYKPATGFYAFCDPMLKEYIRKFGILSLND